MKVTAETVGARHLQYTADLAVVGGDLPLAIAGQPLLKRGRHHLGRKRQRWCIPRLPPSA